MCMHICVHEYVYVYVIFLYFRELCKIKSWDLMQEDWSKIGKGYNKAVYCYPAYFTSN